MAVLGYFSLSSVVFGLSFDFGLRLGLSFSVCCSSNIAGHGKGMTGQGRAGHEVSLIGLAGPRAA